MAPSRPRAAAAHALDDTRSETSALLASKDHPPSSNSREKHHHAPLHHHPISKSKRTAAQSSHAAAAAASSSKTDAAHSMTAMAGASSETLQGQASLDAFTPGVCIPRSALLLTFKRGGNYSSIHLSPHTHASQELQKSHLLITAPSRLLPDPLALSSSLAPAFLPPLAPPLLSLRFLLRAQPSHPLRSIGAGTVQPNHVAPRRPGEQKWEGSGE